MVSAMRRPVEGVILDVDGVLVGERNGYNFPNPQPLVVDALKKARASGIQIVLCTGKPYFSIEKLVFDAGLDGAHIADAGAVIVDVLKEKIVSTQIIDGGLAKEIIEAYLAEGIYAELYTAQDYFVQAGEDPETAGKHAAILQREPKAVKSLASEAKKSEITKIFAVAQDEYEQARLEAILKPFLPEINFSWATHPSALPRQWLLITAKGISKKSAAIRVAELRGLEFENMLGVGDGMGDWQFMELCKLAAAMGNSGKKLKELVKTKGENGFVAPGVDDNGVIDVFEHFIFKK